MSKTNKNAIKLSHIEFTTLMKSRFLRLAVLVVGIIPLLYGALYLWAFWNPYGKLSNVPVAVVNEDSGTITGDKIVNFGDDLTNNLKENQVLKWDFVSEADAETGLTSHKYYAEIKIPSDFSAKIASASSTNPEQGKIIFKAREANSMIGTQLTNRVASQVSDNLSHTITKQYLDNIFAKMHDSAEEVSQAANGTNQLSTGLETAKNGSSALNNGSSSAYEGSVSLVTGINKILLGSKSLDDGINKSLTGAKSLNEGLVTAAAGSSSLVTGSASLTSGVQQVNTGVNQLITNLGSTTSSLATVKSYLADPNTTIVDSASPFNGMTKLQAANYIVSGILANATSPSSQQQITALQKGLTDLSSGSQSLSSGIVSLNDALNNQLEPGSSQLAGGLEQLSDGSNKLQAGISDAKSGSQNLSSGLAQISTGSKGLNSGISDAEMGAKELGKQLSDGAQAAIQNSDVTLTSKLSPIMSNPVTLEDDSIDKVSNYGTGFAPYFIPLALWVGSLVLFLLVKIKDDQTKNANPKSYLFGKYITLAKIGTFQAIVLDLTLVLALDLKPTNILAFFTFSVLISWCFLSVLEFLVATLQDGGKFLGIVLLMLQLTSAGGTYPVQTSPKFFQAINPYLPMTYAVKGLREIISGGNIHNILVSFLFVTLFLTVFLLLILISSKKIMKSKINFSV